MLDEGFICGPPDLHGHSELCWPQRHRAALEESSLTPHLLCKGLRRCRDHLILPRTQGSFLVEGGPAFLGEERSLEGQGSSVQEKGINSGQHSAVFVCISSLRSCFLLLSTLLTSRKGLGVVGIAYMLLMLVTSGWANRAITKSAPFHALFPLSLPSLFCSICLKRAEMK